MSSTGMSLAEHIDELRIRTIHIVICIAIITIFSMSFGIKSVELPIMLPSIDNANQQNNNLTTIKLYYPYPDPFNNIALQLTSFMRDTLLPSGVKLIQTAPGQVFFAQIYISLLIGITCSLPVAIREIVGFVSPAIENRDRGMMTGPKTEYRKKWLSGFNIIKIIFPIFLLFIFGVIISYLLVIPFTLDFLYKYGESIGAETFLTVNDFITFVLQFVLGFGIAFQLPVIMYVLSLSGLTDSRFWKNNFRYAIIIITIFGAIITPDGSGVTMWFVALPMIALYTFAIVMIRRREKDKIII